PSPCPLASARLRQASTCRASSIIWAQRKLFSSRSSWLIEKTHLLGISIATSATSSSRVQSWALAASRTGSAPAASSPHGTSTAGAQRLVPLEGEVPGEDARDELDQLLVLEEVLLRVVGHARLRRPSSACASPPSSRAATARAARAGRTWRAARNIRRSASAGRR